jgi:hypothetical protein
MVFLIEWNNFQGSKKSTGREQRMEELRDLCQLSESASAKAKVDRAHLKRKAS